MSTLKKSFFNPLLRLRNYGSTSLLLDEETEGNSE